MLAGLTLHMGSAGADPVGPALQRPAVSTAAAARSVLQAAARAGQRIVAVGERGIVLLSDDLGGTWRQVPVPVSVGLTAVRFADQTHGWIAGHGGVVLATSDGGQSWVKQLDGLRAAKLLQQDAQSRGDAKAVADADRLLADGADKPFFDLHFFDAQNGWVVGAYNLAFATFDGGKTWQPMSSRLDNPRGLHLYSVAARGSEVVIVGEQGLVLRSVDRAATFARITTPYKGSFFTAALPGARDIVLAGLRGSVWRSSDAGVQWAALANPVPATVTASAMDDTGRLWLANQAGMVLAVSADAALTPAATALPPINGVLSLGADRVLVLSMAGILPVGLKLQQGVSK